MERKLTQGCVCSPLASLSEAGEAGGHGRVAAPGVLAAFIPRFPAKTGQGMRPSLSSSFHSHLTLVHITNPIASADLICCCWDWIFQ